MEQVVNFFVELIKRFGGPTPLFFKILSWLGVAAMIVGFIPDAIVFLNLELSIQWSKTLEVALKVAGLITAIGARLPNQGAIAAVTTTGHPVKATNDNILPFTSEVEKKNVAKADDIPVVTNISTDPKKIGK